MTSPAPAMAADTSTLGEGVARRGLAGGDIEMGTLPAGVASSSSGVTDFRWIDNPTFAGPSFTGHEVATQTTGAGTGPDDAISVSQLGSDSGSVAQSTTEAGSAAAVGLAARGYQNIKAVVQRAGYTAIAPFLPLVQRAGLLTGLPQTPLSKPAALGAATAGFLSGYGVNKLSTAVFGANPNFVYGASTGAAVSGILNLGYSRLSGFDNAARQQAGVLGPYSENMARSLVNGAYGFGVGMIVNAIIAKHDGSGNFTFPPVGNGTQPTDGAGPGRGLLEAAPTGQALADANGIYDQGMQIWHSWMSDPTTKAQVEQTLSGPDGPRAVLQALSTQALSANAVDQANGQLAQFKASDPAGYDKYIANVTSYTMGGNATEGGPERQYSGDASWYTWANDKLNGFVGDKLDSYVQANPNGSLDNFFGSLGPQDRSTIQSYAQSMQRASEHAALDTTAAQTAWRQAVPATTPLSTQPLPALPAAPPPSGLSSGEIIGTSVATGAALGSTLGLAGGPFAEITVPVGAGLGAVGGAIVGGIGAIIHEVA